MLQKGSRVAAIYDIHGYLPALEAVLADLESVRPDLIVVGGDVAAGPIQACEREGVGFIPWYPLATGRLARPGGSLDEVAEHHDATPSQVALAWLLGHSPAMLPIPGTSSVAHLEENVAAATLELTDEEMAMLKRI